MYGNDEENLDILCKKKSTSTAMKNLKSLDIQRLLQLKMLISTILIGFTYKFRYGREIKKQMKIGDGRFSMNIIPETMDCKPVSDVISKRCNCKWYCDLMIWSCNMYGIFCTDSCGKCQDGLSINIPLEEIKSCKLILHVSRNCMNIFNHIV